MTLYLSAFGASLIYIGLKALQQLNVAHYNYRWIAPVSMLMALCEGYIIVAWAREGSGFWLFVPIGLGAGIGAMAAMLFHQRIIKKEERS